MTTGEIENFVVHKIPKQSNYKNILQVDLRKSKKMHLSFSTKNMCATDHVFLKWIYFSWISQYSTLANFSFLKLSKERILENQNTNPTEYELYKNSTPFLQFESF